MAWIPQATGARVPPSEWVDTLARLFPRNDYVSWLELVWHPGTWKRTAAGSWLHDAVDRWVIYQVTPAHATPGIWDETHPIVIRQNRPRPDPRLRIPIAPERLQDYGQRLIYERTGCYSQPFWIIQGSRGGHKRRFSDAEKKLCKLHGAPSDPPVAGSLPYAPFDWRVTQKLVALDRARVWNRAQELYDRDPEALDAEEQQALQEFRAAHWQWLESQVDRAWDETFTATRRPEIRGSHDGSRIDYDRSYESFIRGEAAGAPPLVAA